MKKKTLTTAIAILAMLIVCGGCKRAVEQIKINPHDLLSADKYKKLTLEIQSFKGQEPSETTLKYLQSFLEARLNKPEGITIISTTIDPARSSKYDLTAIRKMEEKYRTRYSSGSEATMYFLFVDGEYAANTSGNYVLGVAYGATSMVIFENSIAQFSGGVGKPSRSSLESAVSAHEIGHIMGLVNNGSDMAVSHEDTDHARHCSNKDCLMYYQAETSDMLANFFGTIPSLDDNCIKDLQKNGGK